MGAAPSDIAAERVVVGVCLNTRHGTESVRDAIEVGDFFSVHLRDLFAAALAMPEIVDLDERVAFAEAFCDATEVEVRELVAESPVMFDAAPWARRVSAEARRRRAMHTLVRAYADLRDGAEIDVVLQAVCAA